MTQAATSPLLPLSPELFARIKAIQIRTQRLVTDMMAGDYESAFKGRGMEFEDVREYQPGDDIRLIDWNVTARMRTPFVKQHKEERELTVILMVDVSSSGAFGSGQRTKNEVAAEVAAILAYTAIKSNDRVGLIIFSDRIEHYVPPKKGRGHVWRVIRDILTFKPDHRCTDLAGAVAYLGKVVRRRSVVFLISDFVDENNDESLRIAAKRHDLTAIRISDPREFELPSVGLIELEDAETGELILVDTRDSNTRDGFCQLGADDRRAMSEAFRKHDIGQINIHTHKSCVEPIVRFFRRREGKGSF